MKYLIAFSIAVFGFVFSVDVFAQDCPGGVYNFNDRRCVRIDRNGKEVVAPRAPSRQSPRPQVRPQPARQTPQALQTANNPASTECTKCYSDGGNGQDCASVCGMPAASAPETECTKCYSDGGNGQDCASVCGMPAAAAPETECAKCYSDGGNGQDCAPVCGMPAAATTTDNPTLAQCLKDFVDKAERCELDGKTAAKECNQDESENKSLKDTRSFTQGMGKSMTAQKAGTGASGQCAVGSMLGTTALFGMDAFKKDCDKEIDECKQACEKVDPKTLAKQMADACSPLLGNEGRSIIADTSVMNEAIENATKLSKDGTKLCKVDAEKESDLVSQLMKGAAQAAEAAKQCQCKLANANANCEMVPSPADCLPNGKLAGTPACVPFANDNCALGSAAYASTPCECARDNTLAKCRTPAAVAVSNFPGIDTKFPSSADDRIGGTSGGEGAGSFNLGGFGGGPANKPVVDDKAGSNGGAGGLPTSAGGGGGGFGGGAGAGAGNPAEPGAAPAEEPSAMGGLFNALKNTASSLFGGKGNGSAGGAGGKPGAGDGKGSKFDLNKFLPRGVAATGCKSSQIGCKNGSIWEQMNQQYDRKKHTFISPSQ